jgi:hypothetical protein
MIEAKPGGPSEAVNQAAAHTLFVEGRGPDAIDPRALTRLLQDTAVSVKPLGPSYHVKSAAQALHPHHPNYYFLIDRDHHDEPEVNGSWANFPDTKKQNLLIWRKRELENYFLDLNYLALSKFLNKCNPAKLMEKLLQAAAERVFLDLANHTIAKIRETQKEKWIEKFTNPSEFTTSAKAISRLKGCTAFSERPTQITKQLEPASVEKVFRKLEAEYLDGSALPKENKGKWIDRMCGKPLLATLVNDCFKVTDTEGRTITGRAAVTLVAEELLQRELREQPTDFQELHSLISARAVPTKR